MSRKRNHRMRPQRVHGLHPFVAIAAAQAIGEAEVTRMMVKLRMRFERLSHGDGDNSDYATLEDMVNIGLVRSEGLGDAKTNEAAVEVFKAAGEAMLECERIRQRHGKFGFTGPHLLAMKDALELYEQLLTLSTPLQMRRAAQDADARRHAGHVLTA